MSTLRPQLVVLDVNETLSDLRPMRTRFTEVGAPEGSAAAWFAGILRDGFALTAVGAQPSFAALARAGLAAVLPETVADRGAAVEHVMAGFMDLPVHPDVRPGLAGLRDAGIRVVTLSNGSADVARSLLGRAGLEEYVEEFLTVEDAGVWKPVASAYAHALGHTGVAAGKALMVAVHPWDIDGAHRAGLRTAWLDRAGTAYPPTFSTPDLVARGLDDLAASLG